MPSEESISHAKTKFVGAVSDGIDSLVAQCGYSRDRATNVLLRELRGDSPRPSDEEIFECMKQYNLGIEEATRAVVMRNVVRAAIDEANPAEAIERLSSKIATSKLVYDSSDDGTDSENDVVIRPELRVDPVMTTEHRMIPSRKKANPNRKSKMQGKATGRTKTKGPSKPSNAGRKRSIDEIASPEKDAASFASRDRADSVSEVVSAKILKQTNIETPATETGVRTSSNVRAKRVHRTEDQDHYPQTSSHKRTRTSEV